MRKSKKSKALATMYDLNYFLNIILFTDGHKGAEVLEIHFHCVVIPLKCELSLCLRSSQERLCPLSRWGVLSCPPPPGRSGFGWIV